MNLKEENPPLPLDVLPIEDGLMDGGIAA